jgi:succinate dehydrogenase / fumarate reductase iron-sulfur subunit
MPRRRLAGEPIVDRPKEFRNCVEGYLCQDACHMLRDNHLCCIRNPRFFVYVAKLEMNPIDAGDRVKALKGELDVGYCNITKCCTTVCPEEIKITDNAMIPLRERVLDDFFNPLGGLFKVLR